jgi:hypothetical protein
VVHIELDGSIEDRGDQLRAATSDVPIVLVALTTNESVSLAVASGASDRPKSTRRLVVFVQVPVTESSSSRSFDSETSSPKARGVTDRLMELIRTRFRPASPE